MKRPSNLQFFFFPPENHKRLTLYYDVYLLSLGIVLLSPDSLDILGSRLDHSNKLKGSVRKK